MAVQGHAVSREGAGVQAQSFDCARVPLPGGLIRFMGLWQAIRLSSGLHPDCPQEGEALWAGETGSGVQLWSWQVATKAVRTSGALARPP